MRPIAAANHQELVAQLGRTGLAVPARSNRTHDDKELFCLRRYLLSLSEARRLHFPVLVEKAESPDFIISLNQNDPIGLEVSEATCEADQREMTAAERAGVEMYSQGEFGGTGRGGFSGAGYEQLWLGYVKSAILKKSRLAYSTNSIRLLLYSSSNAGGFIDSERAVELLLSVRRSDALLVNGSSRFAEVSIIKGDRLIHDCMGQCVSLRLVE